MKTRCSAPFIFVAILCCGVNADMQQGVPVKKVITLLKQMLEKGKKEKDEEQVAFSASQQFCVSTQATKEDAIVQGEQAIDMLKAKVAKATADAARLSKLIARSEKDEDTFRADMAAASKVRNVESADYTTMHADYTESIEAVGRALNVLRKQSHDVSQASFVQISALKNLKLLPDEAKEAIDSFMQQTQGDGVEDSGAPTQDFGAPQANAYESQSGGVVDMMEKLSGEFETERATLERKEINAHQAHNMMMQDLTAQADEAVRDRQRNSKNNAKVLGAKAGHSGDLQAEQKKSAADKKFLADLKSSCAVKASDYESRQQLRTEEIEAVGKAIEIISGGAVSGNADKHLPSLLHKKNSALSQLRSVSVNAQLQKRVKEYLDTAAAKLNSRVLAALSVRVADDPFGKVSKMIKDMVVRLTEEANEEAEHKGWCDAELGTNAATRKDKTEAVETLRADIDQLTASTAKLAGDLAGLAKDLSDLDAAVAQATKIRTEEKTKNAATVSDTRAAQNALARALTVLRNFYAKAAEAASFIQEPYNGQQAESGGVVAMLETIESDFARLESETQTAEGVSQTEYDGFVQDSKLDKADMSTAVEQKTGKKQDQTQTLSEKEADLAGTQKELEAAMSYYDKLKPSCVDSGISFKERVTQRNKEMESLQGALNILSGEDIA